MFEWISGIIERGSYFGLLFLAFIENVFPPIPSELIMPFAGSLAREGKMSFWLAVLVGSSGATLGSLPLYYAGKIMGLKRLKEFADKYGAWLSIDGEDLDKAKGIFDRHQALAVFGCRIVPGIRSFIAVPAGIAKMPVWAFTIYTFAGSFVWTLFLATAGFVLGPSFAQIDKIIGPFSYVILGACVAFIAFRAWKKRKRKRKSGR